MTTTTTKKLVLRRDVASWEMMEKQNLIRIVKTPRTDIKIDWNQNLDGRGVYVQKNLKAIKKAEKTNALSRGLKSSVGAAIYGELIQGLKKDE